MGELQEKLRKACLKTSSNPDELVLARASAEVATGRYAEAVLSLKTCLDRKQGRPAWAASSLAHCHHALGRRKEALSWYRQAVELTDHDPILFARYLVLLVEEEGAAGLAKALPNYNSLTGKLDPRLNATLNAFGAWAAMADGKQKEAFVKAVKAGPYLGLAVKDSFSANGSSSDVDEDMIVCAVVLYCVYEKLGEAEQLAASTNFLKALPPDRVKALRRTFALSK